MLFLRPPFSMSTTLKDLRDQILLVLNDADDYANLVDSRILQTVQDLEMKYSFRYMRKSFPLESTSIYGISVPVIPARFKSIESVDVFEAPLSYLPITSDTILGRASLMEAENVPNAAVVDNGGGPLGFPLGVPKYILLRNHAVYTASVLPIYSLWPVDTDYYQVEFLPMPDTTYAYMVTAYMRTLKGDIAADTDKHWFFDNASSVIENGALLRLASVLRDQELYALSAKTYSSDLSSLLENEMATTEAASSALSFEYQGESQEGLFDANPAQSR